MTVDSGAREFYASIDECGRALIIALSSISGVEPDRIKEVRIRPSLVEFDAYALDENGSKWIKPNGYVALEDTRVYGFSFAGVLNGRHSDD